MSLNFKGWERNYMDVAQLQRNRLFQEHDKYVRQKEGERTMKILIKMGLKVNMQKEDENVTLCTLSPSSRLRFNYQERTGCPPF